MSPLMWSQTSPGGVFHSLVYTRGRALTVCRGVHPGDEAATYYWPHVTDHGRACTRCVARIENRTAWLREIIDNVTGGGS